MTNEENDFSQNPERQLGRELTDFEHELLHRIDLLEKTHDPTRLTDFEHQLLHRVDLLEERVARLPCDHVGFPHDEEWITDDDPDGFEISVDICRNCGERIG